MRWNATDSRCRRRLNPDGTVFLVMPYWPNWVRIAACNCVLRGWPGTTRFIVSTVRRARSRLPSLMKDWPASKNQSIAVSLSAFTIARIHLVINQTTGDDQKRLWVKRVDRGVSLSVGPHLPDEDALNLNALGWIDHGFHRAIGR